jgi:hypothetical protein
MYEELINRLRDPNNTNVSADATKAADIIERLAAIEEEHLSAIHSLSVKKDTLARELKEARTEIRRLNNENFWLSK